MSVRPHSRGESRLSEGLLWAESRRSSQGETSISPKCSTGHESDTSAWKNPGALVGWGATGVGCDGGIPFVSRIKTMT